MKILFTSNLKQKLAELGPQDFADDPKVVAVITSPIDSTAFYITEYRPDEDMFFGYVRGKSIDTWGSFPRQGIESLHEINREMPEYLNEKVQLDKPKSISELLPQLKEQIVFARLDRLIQEHKNKNIHDKEDGIER